MLSWMLLAEEKDHPEYRILALDGRRGKGAPEDEVVRRDTS
jgi:hypothetical protein